MKVNRLAAAILTIPTSALLLAGCNSGSGLGTTCTSFLNKSGPGQKSLAQSYLKQVIGDKNPGAIATFTAEEGLKAYCAGHSDEQLKNITINP